MRRGPRVCAAYARYRGGGARAMQACARASADCASGPLPGGSATNLLMPVEGRYGAGRLALWRSCADIRFDRLSFADLSFENRSVKLCPARGQPILATGPDGTRIAAGTSGLDLAGSLGDTPIRIRSGPVGFAYPGVMKARSLDIALGPEESASRFTLSDLQARLAEGRQLEGCVRDHNVFVLQGVVEVIQLLGDVFLPHACARQGNNFIAISSPPLCPGTAAHDVGIGDDGVEVEAPQMQLREAPRVALDLRRRLRRRCGHALGLLVSSRCPAAREAALISTKRGPRNQGSRGAYQEARDRHLFHAHGAAGAKIYN